MSGIITVKAAQNYVPATQRPACRNCVQGREQFEGLRPGWRCELGAFFVTAFAVCAKHQRKPGVQDPGAAEQEA